MKQGLSLTQMAAALQEQQDAKVDYLAPTDRIHFVAGSGGSAEIDLMGTDASGLRLTDHAHGQLASRLNIPRKFYDRLRLDDGLSGLLNQNVNQLLRHHPNGPAPKWMTRTFDAMGDGGMPTARAFLSDSYRTIDNFDIAQVVLPILGEIPDVRIESTGLTDTRMYIKAVTPRVAGEVKVGDEVCAGVVIRNSEVGVGSFSVEPMVFRLVCLNGMISGTRGEGMMRQIHLGRKLEADGAGRVFSDATRQLRDRTFLSEVQDVVRAAVSDVKFRELIAEMTRAAESEPVTDVAAAVEVLARRESLTEIESKGVLQHLAEGGDLTRWGVLNAITRTAQDVESYDRATELEELGGRVLAYAPADWNALVTA